MTPLEVTCEAIYIAKGQQAVFNYIIEHEPQTQWADCLPCEIESPFYDNACLVCGWTIPPK
jgi:hypothetical protein